MANISTATNERVYRIPKWLGLNEHPDGDTNLKMGEASQMVNWRITRDGNLKRRPGTQFVSGLLQQYKVRYAEDPIEIGIFESTDEFAVYDNVSAMVVPGTITLATEGGGIVESGILSGTGISVSDGVLSYSDDVKIKIENGVLTVSNEGQKMTAEQLADALEDLEGGEYLYVNYDESSYALANSSMVVSGGRYTLNGYTIRAVRDDNGAIVGEAIAGEATLSNGGGDSEVVGLWSGLVMGKHVLLAACNGTLWSLYDEETDRYYRSAVGAISTGKGVSFIPFDGKVYILNGYGYYVYDGATLSVVEGYRPRVAIAIGPVVTDPTDEQAAAESGTTTGEFVNRLNGMRSVWISPDGEAGHRAFKMPDTNIARIDWVKDLKTGEEIKTGWTVDGAAGIVTFASDLPKSVNSYEIAYTVNDTLRSDVTKNLFGELYSGVTDTRIFIYGDGTNRALYSGMDEYGQPRADYFPDQYEVRVGDANTPITSMIRHYNDLVVYKTDSCWSCSMSLTQLATGELMPAVYCVPVNKDKGNVAPGQVYLVDNNPVTASGKELYRWINSSYYSSSITRDERQARRISDRINRSLREMNLPKACACDDNDNQEYYISEGGVTLVWNYVTDTWYRYEGLDISRMCAFRGEFYIGTHDGKILRLTDEVKSDEGWPIIAHWESGAMDFTADYSRKYSSMMWVGLKPEDGTSVDVTVITDRKSNFRDKVVSSSKAKVHGEPFMVKTKIKAKKFVYYRLILDVNDKQPAVTVTNVDFRVRPTGYSK